mmetsp:Transcript_59278/g.133515  ORF Transcript_59278/g.133515 Transcript_59278/m.133515 type:complete len:200 (+) Transcript_59278:629-1228(+)
MPFEEDGAREHAHHGKPRRLNFVDRRQQQGEQNRQQDHEQLRKHRHVRDAVLVLESYQVQLLGRCLVLDEAVPSPVIQHDTAEGQHHHRRDWQVEDEELFESQLHLRTYDNVWRVTYQRGRAAHRGANGHGQIQRPWIQVHLLRQVEGERPKEHDARDVVQDHAQDTAKVREGEEEDSGLLPGEDHDPEAEPVEEAGDR